MSDRKFPEKGLTADPARRQQALRQEALTQLQAGELNLARASLERLAAQTRYRDEEIITLLANLYRQDNEHARLAQLWKHAAIAALAEDREDQFFDFSLEALNSSARTQVPNTDGHSIVQELCDVAQLHAKSHPLRNWVQQHQIRPAAGPVSKQLRVGIALHLADPDPGFANWCRATVEHLPPDTAQLFFYTASNPDAEYPCTPQYESLLQDLRAQNLTVRIPDRSFAPSARLQYLVRQLVKDRIDALIYQTTAASPIWHFVSCLHPAPFQGLVRPGGPESPCEIHLQWATPSSAQNSQPKQTVQEFFDSLCKQCQIDVHRSAAQQQPARLDSAVSAAASEPAELVPQMAQQVNRQENQAALRTAEQLLRTHPDLTGILYGKAVALARLNRSQAAVQALQQLLRVAPQHRRAIHLLHTLQPEINTKAPAASPQHAGRKRTGTMPHAIQPDQIMQEEFESEAETSPDNNCTESTEHTVNSAITALQHGDPAEAVRIINSARRSGTRQPDLEYVRALACVALNELSAALTALHSELESFPHNTAAKNLLVEVEKKLADSQSGAAEDAAKE